MTMPTKNNRPLEVGDVLWKVTVGSWQPKSRNLPGYWVVVKVWQGGGGTGHGPGDRYPDYSNVRLGKVTARGLTDEWEEIVKFEDVANVDTGMAHSITGYQRIGKVHVALCTLGGME